jgi:hypothetical protein
MLFPGYFLKGLEDRGYVVDRAFSAAKLYVEVTQELPRVLSFLAFN